MKINPGWRKSEATVANDVEVLSAVFVAEYLETRFIANKKKREREERLTSTLPIIATVQTISQNFLRMLLLRN